MAQDLISSEIVLSNQMILPTSVGFIASFVTGLIACTWMIKLVRKSKLTYFAIYCFIVGSIALITLL